MKKINALIGQGLDHTKSSQKGGFPLAGPLGLIFSSAKVTASEESKTYAEVIVSMTSKDSAGYANLSSPKLASAKYRQHRSSMPGVTVTSRNAINALAPASLGVCQDNLLNRKEESAFVHASGKEKGPAVSPALLSTSMISCTGESNQLHHNSYLQAIGFAEWQRATQPLGSMPCRLSSWRPSSFSQLPKLTLASLAARSNCPLRSGARRMLNIGALPLPFGLLSLFTVDMYRPVDLVLFVLGLYLITNRSPEELPLSGASDTKQGLTKPLIGVTVMAEHQHTQTRPKFTDTYWIVPCYETTPYGKVLLTRQDRRIFIALFKDSRLIWAGRQLVKDLTENVICTQLQKVGVKRSANSTMSAKGAESRSQFNQSSGLLVRKMPHEGIEEISIPQGGVNITPPSNITNIITVLKVAHG